MSDGSSSSSAKETTITPKEELTLVLVSDTHTRQSQIEVPEGDIFIHAGDFTLFGKQRDYVSANKWFTSLPHPHKLAVTGNHEAALLNRAISNDVEDVEVSGVKLLKDEVVEVEGLRILGTSWFSKLNPAKLKGEVDILITHSPPSLVDRFGLEYISDMVLKLQPKLHVFGHIHHSHGCVKRSADSQFHHDTLFVNASICQNERYKVKYDPVVVRYDRTSKTFSVLSEEVKDFAELEAELS